jgi:hypothetical protein
MGTPALVKQIKKAVEEKRFDALQREKAETAKLCDEALTWLSGEDVRRDFMIVTRRSADGWRHALKYGLLGYSASSDLVVI